MGLTFECDCGLYLYSHLLDAILGGSVLEFFELVLDLFDKALSFLLVVFVELI
jgi:hypothetical protein